MALFRRWFQFILWVLAKLHAIFKVGVLLQCFVIIYNIAYSQLLFKPKCTSFPFTLNVSQPTSDEEVSKLRQEQIISQITLMMI